MELDWVAPVAVAALALTGTFGIAWRFHARAVRRWLTALDAYAERELAQEQRARSETDAEDLRRPGGIVTVRAAPGCPGQLVNQGTVP